MLKIREVVTKLKWRNQSAGNTNKDGTSETLRNETITNTENIQSISVHVPKHYRPMNDEQFGHYLAGLIDGKGIFSVKGQLIIVFHSLDASLAYYLKTRLSCGKVQKMNNKDKDMNKDNDAFIYILSSTVGIEKVLNLINGKLRTDNKYNQIMNNLFKHNNFIEFSAKIVFKLNKETNLKNHWISGYSDAVAKFQITVLNQNNSHSLVQGRIEVRLHYKIDTENESILILLRNNIGGNIVYNKNNNIYSYDSTSYGSAKNIIHYLDHFHLLSSKHVNYLKWRKAYIIVQNKEHLTQKGIDKINKYQNTMIRLDINTIV